MAEINAIGAKITLGKYRFEVAGAAPEGPVGAKAFSVTVGRPCGLLQRKEECVVIADCILYEDARRYLRQFIDEAKAALEALSEVHDRLEPC